MLIKQLLAEGCNEPLLLQQSFWPILGGDSVFIGKKENCKSECLGLGMGGGEDPISGSSQAALAPALALAGTGGQRQGWAVAVLPP